ncbi:phage tail tube protein [Halopseudomonas sp. SMJS2]|uniref:phage tail tube protein n=1 Tax=Halopseudomonas sp. SMJS2 TaxID=3041098 RepID=UPI0024535358|nr:phage tail tube protein [Halopseudomonas sp. SMJS2]WGK60508.1 phage tail tube protein [Halopseudomonas sp. SMJS2]
MAYAQGVNESSYFKLEGADGTLDPATPWQPLRLISNGLSQSFEELESDERLPGRHTAESRRGASSVTGDLEAELTFGTFDMLLEAAFHGTWEGDSLKTGSNRRSFAVLKHNADIGRWLIYRGCEAGTLAIDCPLQGKIGVTFSIIGKAEEIYEYDSETESLAEPTDTVMMTTFEGDLLEGGIGLNHATALNISLDNGMEAIYRLFGRDPYDVKLGRINLSGSLSAYIEDDRLKAKYLGETKTPLVVTLTDGQNSYQISMTQAKLTTATEEGSGDDPIIQSYDLRAFNDKALDTEITITRVAA